MLETHIFKSEDVFFDAFTGNYPKPYYFLGLERSPPLLDVQGVDALATIRYPGGDKVVMPVEVKPHENAIEEYYRLHPLSLQARVVIVFARRHADYELVRKFFFREVERRRAGNVRYDDFFAKLANTEMGSVTLRRIAEMKSARLMQAAE